MKDRFSIQLEAVAVAFSKQPKTMLQVAIETGILRANICRHVETLRKANRIDMIYKGLCPITGYPAQYFQTFDVI